MVESNELGTLARFTPLAVLCIQGLFAWVLWTLRKAFVRGDEYLLHIEREQRLRQEHAAHVATLEKRLHGLEQRISLMPDVRALTELAAAVESLRGDIKTVDMRITGVDRLMLRLEKALERQEAKWS